MHKFRKGKGRVKSRVRAHFNSIRQLCGDRL